MPLLALDPGEGGGDDDCTACPSVEGFQEYPVQPQRLLSLDPDSVFFKAPEPPQQQDEDQAEKSQPLEQQPPAAASGKKCDDYVSGNSSFVFGLKQATIQPELLLHDAGLDAVVFAAVPASKPAPLAGRICGSSGSGQLPGLDPRMDEVFLRLSREMQRQLVTVNDKLDLISSDLRLVRSAATSSAASAAAAVAAGGGGGGHVLHLPSHVKTGPLSSLWRGGLHRSGSSLGDPVSAGPSKISTNKMSRGSTKQSSFVSAPGHVTPQTSLRGSRLIPLRSVRISESVSSDLRKRSVAKMCRRTSRIIQVSEENIFFKLMPILLIFGSIWAFLDGIPHIGVDSKTQWAVDIAMDAAALLELILRFAICPTVGFFVKDLYNFFDMGSVLTLGLRILSICLYGFAKDGTTLARFIVSATPVIRLLRTVRHFEKFNLLMNAFNIALEALPVLLYTQAIIVLFFSCAIILCEKGVNPEIDTLPQAMWFTIVTMMTVGYGDVVPETTQGKFVVSALIVVGGLYNAIPFGIVGSAFGSVWNDRDRVLLMRRFKRCLIQGGYVAEDIPSLFMMFDRQGTGALSASDFEKMIEDMGIGINQERVTDLFNVFDEDGSGAVDSMEFVKTLFPSAYNDIFSTATPGRPSEDVCGAVEEASEQDGSEQDMR